MRPFAPSVTPRRLPATLALGLLAILGSSSLLPAAEPAKPGLKREAFDRDPGWEGVRNRIVPKQVPNITQAFGYETSAFAGRAGELGGQVTRASEPAYYADRIGPKSLDDRLTASGTFALTKTEGNSGVFFGFFRAQQPGAGGRPTSSLGLDLDGEESGGRLAVRLITGKNQSCGTFITPFIPGKYRPTPLRNDGTRYHFKLEYDPNGAGGRGRFTFTLQADPSRPEAGVDRTVAELPEKHRQEALSHFPSTTTFAVDLPEGFKRQNTTFDHFGLMNLMKPGGRMSIHFDDLSYDGRSQDFSRDPQWDASGNRRTYQPEDVAGAHNFGYSASSHAGGKPGEAGGVFWRTDEWGYYADPIGPLSFEDRLEARGRVILVSGGPDSDMSFGWFRAERGGEAPNTAGPFLGIAVGGPTRVGHYFLPAATTGSGLRGQPDRGPVLEPGKPYTWSLVYDPQANGGNGALTATLGTESVTHNLRPGQKAAAREARFDHFGLFSHGPGGQIVKLYLDDLEYTAASGASGK